MIHSVSAPTFQGPLGLLLELAEKGKIELSAISVREITARYLAHVQSMDNLEPEELSDFLRLGSRLLYIKSLSLLPADGKSEQQDELSRLSLELDEYRRFQQVARTLGARQSTPSWHRAAVTHLTPEELPLPDINLNVLQEAFTRALRRAEPLSPQATLEHVVSQESVMNSLRKRLKGGSFNLQLVLALARDRYEIIVSFLALLELLKTGEARVSQDGQFAAIMIESARA